MKILAIGNSFSQDATTYIEDIANSMGIEDITAANLYIPGCPLTKHAENLKTDELEYEYQLRGKGIYKTSIHAALVSDDWDVITMQQASPSSPKYETYQPYLNELSAYVRRLCPKAKQVIHQTWAYEKDSEKLTVLMKYERAEQMTADILAAYARAAADIGADAVIPSGELMAKMLANGLEKVHRDTFHASLGAGRYGLALLWYAVLTGKDVSADAFDDFDVEVTPAERECVIRSVCEILQK